MSRRIDFFFDILSPYTWIGFEVLHRYAPVWKVQVGLRPMLLREVMRSTCNQPPGSVPAKAKYMTGTDLPLMARHHGVPLVMNEAVVHRMFHVGARATMQFLTAVQRLQPQAVQPLCRQLWLRLFARHLDIHDAVSLKEAAALAGVGDETTEKALADMHSDAVKERLRLTIEEAVAEGAFGSPTFVVHLPAGGRQMIFGCDRFNLIADLIGEKYRGPMRPESKM